MSERPPAISVGEGIAIIANLGVVIGLVLVWMELRQSQVQLQAEVELTLATAYQTVLGRVVENPDMAAVQVIAYRDGPNSLTMPQYIQLMSNHAEWMSVVYATYQLRQSGAISEATWDYHARHYLMLLQTEDMQLFWREMQHGDELYPQDFIDELEARLPEPRPPFGVAKPSPAAEP